MTFKEEVKLYLKSKKITQREFASWVGISGNYVQAILAGRANPRESVKSKMLHLCKLEKVSECVEKHNRCYGCFYRRAVPTIGCTVYACHYMIDTGKKRGVTPQECYKHEGTPYKKKQKGMTARKSVYLVTTKGKQV